VPWCSERQVAGVVDSINSVGINSNMKAVPVLRERLSVGDGAFVEIAIWDVPRPVQGSSHRFKYRLALVVQDVCVMRYDNEAGKGDHKHEGGTQTSYRFVDVQRLETDFFEDVRQWLATKATTD
jgi:Family of unknown function (DUF6516)